MQEEIRLAEERATKAEIQIEKLKKQIRQLTEKKAGLHKRSWTATLHSKDANGTTHMCRAMVVSFEKIYRGSKFKTIMRYSLV
jgi:hypothetical protein